MPRQLRSDLLFLLRTRHGWNHASKIFHRIQLAASLHDRDAHRVHPRIQQVRAMCRRMHPLIVDLPGCGSFRNILRNRAAMQPHLLHTHNNVRLTRQLMRSAFPTQPCAAHVPTPLSSMRDLDAAAPIPATIDPDWSPAAGRQPLSARHHSFESSALVATTSARQKEYQPAINTIGFLQRIALLFICRFSFVWSSFNRLCDT